MATDSFTASNNTEIGAHSAGGNTWVGLATAEPIGKINDNQLGYGDGFTVSARASNSSADFSQVVIKAGSYVAGTKSVHVRASLANQGYQLQVTGISGDAITQLALKKNEAYLTVADTTALSKSRLVDHTLAIKATASGGDVQLKGYIDGTEVTFEDTSSTNDADSTTFTDLAANTPLSAGNPGVTVPFEDGMNDAASRLDDWTDVEPSGGSTKNRSRGTGGGFVDLCGGLE